MDPLGNFCGLKQGRQAGFLLLAGGSWVLISRVTSRVTILITHVGGLIAPLISTLNPKSL